MFSKKGTTVIVLMFFLLTVFFLTAKNFDIKKVKAQGKESVVINEIAWMGTASSSHREWLEFFNFGTSTRDISTWSIFGADTGECLNFSQADGSAQTKINPGDYLIYGNEENIFENLSVDIWDATIGLNNSNPGDLKLFNDSDCAEGVGVIIDEVNNTEEWVTGNSEKLKTMERTESESWQTSAQAGGTPGEENSEGEGEPDKEDDPKNQEEKDNSNFSPDTSAGTSFSSGNTKQKSYRKEDVLLTELVSDPEEGEEEWVEIKNNSGKLIDLRDWFLEEGSGSRTKLKGELSPGSFLQIEKIKGNLNNSGDSLFLKSPGEKIIDQVSYGDQSESNPAPDSPLSLARKGNSWKLTSQKTPGKANLIKKERKTETKTRDKEITITEIFPNPEKSDREKEFIELFNPTDREINLTGWKLSSNSGREYIIGKHDLKNYPVKIKPQGYLVIYRSRSFLPLNNNGDTLGFYKPDKNTPRQSLSYSRAAPGLSYNRTKDLLASSSDASTKKFLTHSTRAGDWVWSREQTPGEKNQIKEVNRPPQVSFSCPRDLEPREDIFFDASDTFDENGDKLSYTWSFGDGVELKTPFPSHAFLSPGKYRVKLQVSDGGVTSSKVKNLVVGDYKERESQVKKEETKKEKDSTSESKQIIGEKIIHPAPENKTSKETSFLSIAEVKKKEEGAKVLTKGKVAVLPGVLASQYFYIVGSPGIQVYNYFKDFPDLARGDLVEVKGEISKSRGEKRIKTNDASDIRILKKDQSLTPENFSCAEIGVDKAGSLVKISGEVTEIKSPKIYIDDGQAETLIYIQEEIGIEAGRFDEGEVFRVAGLVNNYNGQARVMPRSPEDIELISKNQNHSEPENQTNSSGDKPSSTLVLPGEKKDKSLGFYIILGLTATLLVLGSVFITKRIDSRQ